MKSAERVLEILDLLARSRRGMTFTEISSELSLPKSSTHALLNTMASRGFLAVEGHDRRFRLGMRVWEAGQAYLAAGSLEQTALPVMERLRDELNEIVQLAVLDGTDNVYIAKVDPDQALVLASHVGVRLPAYATAIGKVLLSDLSDDGVRARFADVRFRSFTERTLPGVDELVDEVRSARSRGYAVDLGEYTPGVFCIAAPVRDHTGAVRAGMSVSVPEVRMNDEFRDTIRSALVREAARIAQQLGYRA